MARLAVFASFGLFASLASALLIAVFLAPLFSSLFLGAAAHRATTWPTDVPNGWHSPPTEQRDFVGWGWSATAVSGINQIDAQRLAKFARESFGGSIHVENVAARVLRVGWPFMSFQVESVTNQLADDNGWRTGIGIEPQGERRIPLKPRWAGFLANSAIFSLLPVALQLVFARFRHARALFGEPSRASV